MSDLGGTCCELDDAMSAIFLPVRGVPGPIGPRGRLHKVSFSIPIPISDQIQHLT